MNKAQFQRLFLYGVVGVTVSAVYVLFTVFFTEVIGLTPIAASALAYIASFLLSFVGNHRVVFMSNENMSRTIVRFALVSAFIFFLTSAIMYLAVEVLRVPYLYGVTVVLIVVPLSNFSLHLLWTFKKRPGN